MPRKTYAPLQIYAAQMWHDPITILGTADSLSELAAAIIDAVETGAAYATGMSSDGEGFSVDILLIDSLGEREDIPLHYIEEIARDDIPMPPDIDERLRKLLRLRVPR